MAILERHDVPAHRPEGALDPEKEPVLDDAVEALAIVVDDPPDIPDVVLPAFQEGLENVALVELGIAGQGDHPAAGPSPGRSCFEPDIVLDQGGEQGDGHPQADRARREVDIVAVLGPRRIGLRPPSPEPLELLPHCRPSK